MVRTHVVEISFLLVGSVGDVLIAVCILGRSSLLKHFSQSLLQLRVPVLQLMTFSHRLLYITRLCSATYVR